MNYLDTICRCGHRYGDHVGGEQGTRHAGCNVGNCSCAGHLGTADRMTLQQAIASGEQFRRRAWKNWWRRWPDGGWCVTTMGGSPQEPVEIDPALWPQADREADDFELRRWEIEFYATAEGQ